MSEPIPGDCIQQQIRSPPAAATSIRTTASHVSPGASPSFLHQYQPGFVGRVLLHSLAFTIWFYVNPGAESRKMLTSLSGSCKQSDMQLPLKSVDAINPKPKPMKTPKIEKGFPIPRRQTYGVCTETLRNMKVGDSVILPVGASASWRSSALKLGFKIASRTISDTECRLWRAA